jgi:hypothetical protein
MSSQQAKFQLLPWQKPRESVGGIGHEHAKLGAAMSRKHVFVLVSDYKKRDGKYAEPYEDSEVEVTLESHEQLFGKEIANLRLWYIHANQPRD